MDRKNKEGIERDKKRDKKGIEREYLKIIILCDTLYLFTTLCLG